MNAAPNPFKTRTYQAPRDMPDCHPLEVTETEGHVISAWEPTEKEIAAMQAGEKVWLYIQVGETYYQPPVMIHVGERPGDYKNA